MVDQHVREHLRAPAQRVLAAYPVDFALFIRQPSGTMMEPEKMELHTAAFRVQDALLAWNRYFAGEDARVRFLADVDWLVTHEVRVGPDAGGWPLTLEASTRCALSAVVQGMALSALARAYALTGEELLLSLMRRVLCTYALDILDGGIAAPIGAQGVFFERVAVYPAQHELAGCLIALIGLYDYVTVTDDERARELAARALTTLHQLLASFDAGYWTYSDLAQRQLSSPSLLALHYTLLAAVGHYADCTHCVELARRWQSYVYSPIARLRYRINAGTARLGHGLLAVARRALLPIAPREEEALRVCVPVAAFPLTGGIRSVLAKIAAVMEDRWRLEYITQHLGPDADKYSIHRFGTALMSPRLFPTFWLYMAAGLHKLISLQRSGAHYQVMLPQDCGFTAAFAVLASQLLDTRVVCIDHGVLSLLEDHTMVSQQRLAAQDTKRWPRLRKAVLRIQNLFYWPSLWLTARFAVSSVDHLLIPGVEGDGIDEVCTRLGVMPGRLTRFATMIEQVSVLDASAQARVRARYGIAPHALVIVLVCRLAPEKGIDIALAAIEQALSSCSPEMRAAVYVVIAGDGPLRGSIERDIAQRALTDSVVLAGELPATDVSALLGASDIFLYTSTRGACLSVSLLEAMAAGCAIIASTLPLANVHMLAEGRGTTVPPGNVEATGRALISLLDDAGRRQRMGERARAYVALHHSPTAFRRVLLRATSWSDLDQIISRSLDHL
ncbi:MAG TPA: glycosyltransferase [Ktedonobacteraceae bacterium]|nr:glycosyltransferase [Ktedonobacteraceae bacterium]